MRECLDEGTLQSYADGELSLEMTEAVLMHIGACAVCAGAAREAESESAILMAALAPEMSVSVPTARLRARLEEAIIAEQPQQTRPLREDSGSSRLRSWFAALVAPLAFAPRQAIGFASLAAVVALALIFSAVYLRRSGSEYAQGETASAPVAFSIPELRAPQINVSVPEEQTPVEQVIRVKHQIKSAAPLVRKNMQSNRETIASNSPETKSSAAPADTLLPGERSYLTAIASLTTTLETSGEAALKPSLRVEYERNLAVVDQAIEETRRVARSNPNDEDAANFLLVAYQSKVDLLNTVAEQARLSAAVR